MKPAIAYLAAELPSLHETFVYREIRELRGRGWRVEAGSLHEPPALPSDRYDDLLEDLVIVYRKGWLGAALAECFAHPRRSLATLSLALGDALAPGERTPLVGRAKLVAQAIAGLALARELRARRVRRIHCHFAHSPTSVGMYAARQLLVPFSFTGHANDLFQRRSLLGKKLRRAAFVCCISHWHRNLYREIEPEGSAKYVVVRCGVDTSTWHGVPASGPEAGPLRMLCVCRLVEKKGVDVLIRAFARMQREGTLTVAGDGPERDRLRALARELGCDSRVEWLGAVENERVLALMHSADVFVLACRTDAQGDRDGIPVVLMEAMACGLAVVSGDIPSIRELIEDGVDGLLAPEGDSAQLAGQLERLTAERRRALGESARRKIEAEFSLSSNVDRLEALLGVDA